MKIFLLFAMIFSNMQGIAPENSGIVIKTNITESKIVDICSKDQRECDNVKKRKESLEVHDIGNITPRIIGVLQSPPAWKIDFLGKGAIMYELFSYIDGNITDYISVQTPCDKGSLKKLFLAFKALQGVELEGLTIHFDGCAKSEVVLTSAQWEILSTLQSTSCLELRGSVKIDSSVVDILYENRKNIKNWADNSSGTRDLEYGETIKKIANISYVCGL